MFGEQSKEFNPKTGAEVPVWKSPKYMDARAKVAKLLEEGKFDLTENDFWIQKNMNKKGDKMIYTGLIISHNGCLRINDKLSLKFDPSSVSIDKDGYGRSLVVGYCNPEQGLFEFGEVNADNCKIAYPYAMALKRCFDRVVLKLSKIAYSGVYADAESDEFAEDDDARAEAAEKNAEAMKRIVPETPVCPICGLEVKDTKTKDGGIMTAQEIFARYGMCADCKKASK